MNIHTLYTNTTHSTLSLYTRHMYTYTYYIHSQYIIAIHFALLYEYRSRVQCCTDGVYTLPHYLAAKKAERPGGRSRQGEQ